MKEKAAGGFKEIGHPRSRAVEGNKVSTFAAFSEDLFQERKVSPQIVLLFFILNGPIALLATSRPLRASPLHRVGRKQRLGPYFFPFPPSTP